LGEGSGVEATLRLIQFKDDKGLRAVGVVDADGDHAVTLKGFATVYDLANKALDRGIGLSALVTEAATGERVDYAALLKAGRVLPPVDHPEEARFLITGTGLTHTGSAAARNKMHVVAHGSNAPETDSMKIFRMGLEGGKPAKGQIGVQPEWFFKGTAQCIVAPGAALPMPAFALAGGEEPEVVGIYILDKNGAPFRIGFTLGNEFSDHVTEAQNYLFTAHSKLRACSIGPELLLGELPHEVRGKTRVIRDGKILWEDDFLSGEANMSHTVANLEHHHFKYDMFRRPGDLHAYFFGAAVLSSAAGVKTQPGDEFEIVAPAFGKPLRNRMETMKDEGLVTVRTL
jgi:hypothetical protein